MPETPTCPNCNIPFVPLSDHDKAALAIANNHPWVCQKCLCLSNGGATPIPFESVMAQERSYYLALIQTLRTIETRKTLLEVCEALRAAFAVGGPVRYAWANVTPELFRE